MTTGENSRVTRRTLLGAFAGIPAIVAAPSYAGVFSFNKGAGDIRRIKMYSGRTGESIDTIYWIEGEYIKEALKEINWFMRDWRQDAVTTYDPRNIDIMAAAVRLMDTDEAFQLLSGYRSASTNAMLRRRNRGVARKSYHVRGMAADLRLKSRGIQQMAAAAKAINSGGVGVYRRSNFVHMDSGPIRTWRR
jgi:uncharacterized protein YcbK (DUF882 family)